MASVSVSLPGADEGDTVYTRSAIESSAETFMKASDQKVSTELIPLPLSPTIDTGSFAATFEDGAGSQNSLEKQASPSSFKDRSVPTVEDAHQTSKTDHGEPARDGSSESKANAAREASRTSLAETKIDMSLAASGAEEEADLPEPNWHIVPVRSKRQKNVSPALNKSSTIEDFSANARSRLWDPTQPRNLILGWNTHCSPKIKGRYRL